MGGVQARGVVFLSTTGSFVCLFDYSLSSSISSINFLVKFSSFLFRSMFFALLTSGFAHSMPSARLRSWNYVPRRCQDFGSTFPFVQIPIFSTY